MENIEFLHDPSTTNLKGRTMIDALLRACPWPARCVVTSAYRGDARWLFLYGAGRLDRFDAMRKHLRRGGHIVCIDLGYWDREQGAMRVSVDALHPSESMLDLAAHLPPRRAFTLRADSRKDGPVMLVGMGPKSNAQFGLSEMQWERGALERIRAKYPRAQVFLRPKKRAGANSLGLPQCVGLSIEDALRGCSLVVCRHSNVAIDACVAGVPVWCDDGAARTLYSYSEAPLVEERLHFLRCLSWWNWSPFEAKELWGWLIQVAGAFNA